MLLLSFFLLITVAVLLVIDRWIVPGRVWHQLSGGIVVGLAVLSFVVVAGPFVRDLWNKKTSMLEPWNVFHYYLNTKYFAELGYWDLYGCAYEADQEGIHLLNDQTVPARNLYTYQYVTQKNQLPRCPHERFTPDRWSTFKADLTWLESRPVTLPGDYGTDVRLYWNNILTDKGYNLPPPFIILGQAVTRLIPLNTALGFLLFSLDIFSIIFAFVLLGHWKSWRLASLLTIFLVYFFGTYRELSGLFLQHIWFPLVLLSLLAWEKRWIKVSAGLLAVAGAMRLFPLFFAIGPFVQLLLAVYRQDLQPRALLFRWFGTLALVTLVLFMVGSFAGGGLSVWGDYYAKMHLHTQYIRSEWFDIGFKNMFSSFMLANAQTHPFFASLFESTLLRWAVTIIPLGVFLWLSAKRSFQEAFILGIVPIYLLLDLSPFYYFILGLPLWFAFQATSDRVWKWLGSLVFVLLALHVYFGWLGPGYTWDILMLQPISDPLICMFLFGGLGALLVSTRKRPVHDAASSALRT